jgi:glycosyltransferase involved in cell wall biosynthesis
MRCWLVNITDPLPIDGDHVRLLRMGTLAGFLAARGHTVMWWASTFDHYRKRHRFDRDTSVDVDGRLSVRLLHGCGYKSNVSLARLVDHAILGMKFAAQARRANRPDIILASLPTLELCREACRYGKARSVPVVVDIRDLWPDVFADAFPPKIRKIGHWLLAPYRTMARRACRDASAIVGPTEEFVEWGLKLARRRKGPADIEFPFGYSDEAPTVSQIEDGKAFWKKWEVSEDRNDFIVCFFGTLGRYFDLDTVLRAARQLHKASPRIRFVICGTGDREGYYRSLAQQCSNVVLPGWVDKPEIWTLMRMSAVGLAPYRLSENFLRNVPNKVIEYLSASLPVFYCLDGALDRLLGRGAGGVRYRYEDADDLASQLCSLEQCPERLRGLSEAAASLYRSRFQAHQVYSGMVRYLEEIASGFPAGVHRAMSTPR